MAQIKTILFPTAFSELAIRASAFVRLLAQAHNAQVFVLHAIPPEAMSPGPMPMGPGTAGLPDPAAALNLAQENLRRFAGDHLPGVPAETECIVGSPAREITSFAERKGVDLIIMGTHADGVLKRLIFGSVSKAVLESSPCPVLLVPVHGAKR